MEKIFERDITQVIKERYSVRNYSEKEIEEEKLKKIRNYIKNLDNPFNIKVKIELIEKTNNNSSSEGKIGTYGVIKGDRYYLVGIMKEEGFSYEALGYTMEKAILYCTSLGLSTVWLGGTFSKGSFSKKARLEKDELIPVVSPVGYEGGTKTLIGKLIGSNKGKRKVFEELFFKGDFNTPLTENNTPDTLKEAFEMVRLAPSSMNKQPWRVILINEAINFYNSGKINMNKIDMGIALCHIDLYFKEKAYNYEFRFEKPNIESKYEYVISLMKK